MLAARTNDLTRSSEVVINTVETTEGIEPSTSSFEDWRSSPIELRGHVTVWTGCFEI